MLYLFRHYRIEPKLNRYAVLLIFSVVAIWLYFSFVEKSFVGKMISGDALIVDLVLGLPLVLMLTIIVYACAYWSCKLIIIFLLPQAMIPYSAKNQMNEEEKRQEKKPHGNCRNKIDSEHYNRMTNNKPHDNTPDE